MQRSIDCSLSHCGRMRRNNQRLASAKPVILWVAAVRSQFAIDLANHASGVSCRRKRDEFCLVESTLEVKLMLLCCQGLR
jgi:hypothetical protein